jgi:type II secretory pathway pseudopilin PulG
MISRRTGFTMLESTLALAMLGVGLILVSQLTVQSFAERKRNVERLAAIEHCNNLLETARSIPWPQLTSDWARQQRLPNDLADWLLDPKLAVRVEQFEPRVKKVTVELRWEHTAGVAARPASLTALFADRDGGGEP